MSNIGRFFLYLVTCPLWGPYFIWTCEWKYKKLLIAMALWLYMTLQWMILYPDNALAWFSIGTLGAFLVQQRLFNGKPI